MDCLSLVCSQYLYYGNCIRWSVVKSTSGCVSGSISSLPISTSSLTVSVGQDFQIFLFAIVFFFSFLVGVYVASNS